MTEQISIKWITRREAALRLRVHPKTITRWVELGLITKHELVPGGHALFDLEEIDEFVRSRCFTKTPGDEVAVA